LMPPKKNMTSANVRYIVPMSLWFVAYSHRRQPVGAWWWSSCAWSCGSSTALISCSCLGSVFRVSIGASARRRQGARLHRASRRVVAPRVARVGDHRRELDIGELREGSHGGARPALQEHLDLVGGVALDDVRAVERRERTRHALAVGLVAGDAVGAID